jgi:hypothetical protein
MSPFSNSERKWLKNAEIAEVLGRNARTVKRWLSRQQTREVLGAIRNGKQWRIPRPGNLEHWYGETRQRLVGAGVRPKLHRKSALEKMFSSLKRFARTKSRDLLERYRFRLACELAVVTAGPITPQDKLAFDQLWRASEKVKTRRGIPAELSKTGLSAKEIREVMSRLPKKKQLAEFDRVRTLDELEPIRQRIDFTQAVRILEERGQKPTAANIGPLLHRDIIAHMNDTGEELPGIVVRAQSTEQLRKITLASVCDYVRGKTPPLLALDFRQPQPGTARRTVQTRHPLKQQTQREIVGSVYGIRISPPSAEQKPQSI